MRFEVFRQVPTSSTPPSDPLIDANIDASEGVVFPVMSDAIS
jgi:hypothetical protein